MCRRVECSKCGKPTYAGCGMHIEQVLGDVAPEKRCRCREEAATKPPNSQERQSRLRRFLRF
jgi:hypothetical protein